MRIVMLGPRGAGKGTQSKRLCERLGIPHLSVGALLREQITAGTDVGEQVAKLLATGELVPDEITLKLLMERLAREDHANGWVIDGFPRTMKQALALGRDLAEAGEYLDHVLYLEVNEAEGLKRAMASGQVRPDDTEEAISGAWSTWRQTSGPILSVFEDRDQLTRINGRGTPDEVAERIREAIGA